MYSGAMMLVSTTNIGAWGASVTTLCNRCFDILRCRNKPTTQLHWLWELRLARFASAERGLEQFRYNVFEFLVLMDSANFDVVHEFVRKIEGRFHFAIFPESCFSVNLATQPQCWQAPWNGSLTTRAKPTTAPGGISINGKTCVAT